MQGSVQLVLGATGGIGSALARQLAAQEAQLVLAGRDEARLAALGRDLGASTRVFDATDTDATVDWVHSAAKEFGRVDGIANCIGSLLLKPGHLTKVEEWDHTIATNLTTAFGVVRAAGRAMRKTGGSVVLLSTAAASIGLPNHEAIAAAKAGIEGMARSAASTYAREQIRFNVVAPGLTRTPLTTHITGNEAAAAASSAMHPLQRFGEAPEVASAIRWLLDPDQAFVTGQVIGVDGGLARVRSR
ncbi:MAG: SDR family oxidoreductase [Planctomycetota bacterium]